ncbi:MAG: sugar transferase [Opitutae bacterium]|jgi:lipopolysaccharide/colanic/teichoic acid biosynthesis glycosyltransferase|nr:sugar transferase [Opitutae bacterium]
MIRFFDILFSGLALVVLSPLFLPIILILGLTGEGKIFYKQDRVGRNGKTFRLLKFATMLENSPNLPGGDITSGDDPRVLPVGKFLRKTKINELPQLINILKGELSVVGPRPLTPQNFRYYEISVQKIIFQKQPGLTGIGSIVFRDEETIINRSKKKTLDCYREEIAPYKGELEKWFMPKHNIRFYFLLIFLTAWVVLSPKSKIIWKVFPSIPIPPKSLQQNLGYSAF